MMFAAITTSLESRLLLNFNYKLSGESQRKGKVTKLKQMYNPRKCKMRCMCKTKKTQESNQESIKHK